MEWLKIVCQTGGFRAAGFCVDQVVPFFGHHCSWSLRIHVASSPHPGGQAILCTNENRKWNFDVYQGSVCDLCVMTLRSWRKKNIKKIIFYQLKKINKKHSCLENFCFNRHICSYFFFENLLGPGGVMGGYFLGGSSYCLILPISIWVHRLGLAKKSTCSQ